jgi:TolB-like protein/class 3 adenylate cyclase
MRDDRRERRLRAILAAKIASNTDPSHADPEGAPGTSVAFWRDLVDPMIAKYRGRMFKTTLDGYLVEFVSSVDAVSCAVATQQGMAERNREAARERRSLFRIGVNVGDIVIDGDDIVGDGVNVAVLLSSIAEPGTILVSAGVHEDARGTRDVAFDEIGECQLKNMTRPVRVFRVRPGLDAESAPVAVVSPPRLPDRPSIAVLPFQNMSGDPDQDYFADGMVEDIITGLSRYRWLFVIARNSSFTYKGRAIDVKQVGRELDVGFVLEGSVRKAGNRVRITAQLIDATNGMHLWAERYDGTLEDVFDLQDSVTAQVVGQLAPTLERAEIERVKRKPTGNQDAYDYYMRAMSLLHRHTRESVTEALEYFRKAIGLDPDFAAAHGMAALSYVLFKVNGWVVELSELVDVARLARRGTELGKDDAVALYSAGFALVLIVQDIDDGAAFIARALVLAPSFAPAWQFSSWVQVSLGEHEAAIEHGETSLRLSPFDPLAYVALAAVGAAHFYRGRYDEAASCAEKSIREQPRFATAWRVAAASHALAGRIVEARNAIARVLELDPGLRMSNLHKLPLRRPQDRALWDKAFRTLGLAD